MNHNHQWGCNTMLRCSSSPSHSHTDFCSPSPFEEAENRPKNTEPINYSTTRRKNGKSFGFFQNFAPFGRSARSSTAAATSRRKPAKKTNQILQIPPDVTRATNDLFSLFSLDPRQNDRRRPKSGISFCRSARRLLLDIRPKKCDSVAAGRPGGKFVFPPAGKRRLFAATPIRNSTASVSTKYCHEKYSNQNYSSIIIFGPEDCNATQDSRRNFFIHPPAAKTEERSTDNITSTLQISTLTPIIHHYSNNEENKNGKNNGKSEKTIVSLAAME